MKKLRLNYLGLTKVKVILVVTPIVVIAYLGIIYFHPIGNHWLTNGSFTWLNMIKFVFVDQIAIELFTFFIISFAILYYAKTLKLFSVEMSIKGFLLYQLKFFPLFLLIFFVFNPITQSVRYWYHNFPTWNSELYFESYYYSIRLYLSYLLPVFLGGYALLNINLYFNYHRLIFEEKEEAIKSNKIAAADGEGKTFIDLMKVVSFERVKRNYFAFTDNEGLRINYNMGELEKMLDDSIFYRINRSTVININYFKNYSFWENDKYVLRLVNGKEYIVSRNRIMKLKAQKAFNVDERV